MGKGELREKERRGQEKNQKERQGENREGRE